MASIKSTIQLYDNASSPLRKISDAIETCIGSFRTLQSACNNAVDTSSMDNTANKITNIENNVSQVGNSIDKATQKQKQFDKTIQKTNKSAELLKSAFKTLAMYIGVKEVIELSDKMTQVKARLDLINDGLQTTEDLQTKIFVAAQKSRASYLDMVDIVGKLGITAKKAFTSNDEMIAFADQLNKHFTIAGTNAEGIRGATLQLTQALGSGVLRGQELNSVFEQVPTVIEKIAEYLDVDIGRIRLMAAEGQITAQIVKNALLSTIDETNKAFDKMPKTFAQKMQSVKNIALRNFQPILNKINELFNTPKFTEFVNNVTSAISIIANFCVIAFDAIVNVINVIASGWDYVSIILNGVIGIMGAYLIALGLCKLFAMAHSIAEGIRAGTLLASAKAALIAKAAQWGLNAAVLASPIFWIPALIIALITIIALLCQWIVNTTKVCDSAFGFITGAFTVMLAICYNMLIGVFNAMLQVIWTVFVEPAISIIEFLLNAFMGGFDSFGDAVANLLGQIIGWFLSLGTVVTRIIDAIFGTDWTSGLESLKDKVTAWGKNENSITLDRNVDDSIFLKRMDYGDAFKAGSEWGDGVSKKLSNVFNPKLDLEALKSPLDNIDANTYDNAYDTAKIADSLGELEDNIQWMLDVAEREVINRFTTAEIKVEQTNNNNISSILDLDAIMEKWNNDLTEVLETASEGVY